MTTAIGHGNYSVGNKNDNNELKLQKLKLHENYGVNAHVAANPLSNSNLPGGIFTHPGALS